MSNKPELSAFFKSKEAPTPDTATRDYIIEVAYYMERVNNKILQYENEA